MIPLEIQRMEVEELRTKIINVATAYRDERMRNEEFERAIKESEAQLNKISQIENELEEMRVKHQEDSKKF